MARPTQRIGLLEAAARVVRRDGVAHLTLDAVAAEAGTSKGGLLYHFASKDALVSAMVEAMAVSFVASVEAAAAADPAVSGRWTRAYVRTTTSPGGPSDEDATASALLAAIASDSALADPLRARYAEWRDRVRDDGIPVEDALVASLAADGLWMADILGFAAPEGPERARVIARMITLAGGAR